ncbi:Gfo/Idh/MocA family protein [Vagococcus lutrae]|uniref:Gfo/Idh/MocA family protein n=1 Tax=Vagococcus lutrae TaxID=81947 RepID=UPI00200E42B3|nr:Gfo/Idh/MocA family oxidoreductase [Vagococcus lutrae]MDT2823190.1 Gfo/Idh/MocA family oxidoreductase [Vagococcus lutrae]UQF19058.1 Gfo/Idh/MocA family oxidoreductase [Vagococcus lutrae]
MVLKIGVMGLGTIAQKAYLPIMNQLQTNVEWHYFTRNKETRERLANQYQWQFVYDDFQTFYEADLDACFIHTSTSTHYTFIKMFLEKGVHVYVDKPISENLDEVKELLALAKQQQCLLFTGFNRRRAPMVQQLKEVPDKNMIIVQKNIMGTSKSLKEILYDLFIHVVDTGLFLMEGAVQQHYIDLQINEANQSLERVCLHLSNQQNTVICITNLNSGARTESIEVQSPSGTYHVHNLAQLNHTTPDGTIHQTFPDWTPTLEKRGFETTIKEFLTLVKQDATYYDDSLAYHSHKWIEAIVKKGNE